MILMSVFYIILTNSKIYCIIRIKIFDFMFYTIFNALTNYCVLKNTIFKSVIWYDILPLRKYLPEKLCVLENTK